MSCKGLPGLKLILWSVLCVLCVFLFQGGGAKGQNIHLEQKLYDGVSATSTWLDDVEERLFVATALLPEETEACLSNQEVRPTISVCVWNFKAIAVLIIGN